MIDTFEKSPVWVDMRNMLLERLRLNYQDLLIPDFGLPELKLLQGSSAEMHAMLELPQLLRGAIQLKIDKQKQEQTVGNENARTNTNTFDTRAAPDASTGNWN